MTPSTFSPTTPIKASNSPTTATISLSALVHNLEETRRILSPDCTIMAIVKADGYGHGGIMIARTLSKHGVFRFGVATVQEAVSLRESGIQEEVIVLGGQFDCQVGDLLHHQLIPVISDVGMVKYYLRGHNTATIPYPVYLKVDTGMERLGLSPKEALNLLRDQDFSRAFSVQGLMTHLADADNPNPEFTQEQLFLFQQFINSLKERSIPVPSLSIANSAGILFHPDSHVDLVRPGLMLFGYAPIQGRKLPVNLEPVMRLTTRIVQIRTVEPDRPISYNGIFRTKRRSRIGILPIGYANGYSRRLSNIGKVLVGNSYAPIIGRVCMDMTIIDVTDVPEIQVGDEVVMMGQQGNLAISCWDIASWQDTAPYEVLCNLGPRVNRQYEGPK